jgi:hypothetical protein
LKIGNIIQNFIDFYQKMYYSKSCRGLKASQPPYSEASYEVSSNQPCASGTKEAADENIDFQKYEEITT